jgi:hypothetical protein
MYNEINERLSLERNQVIAIYCNSFFSFLNFLILFIIAVELGPVVKDAGILLKDVGVTLKDISIMVPEINRLIPEARNTTLILGHMVPEINQGMYILRQLCIQDSICHLF